MERILVIGANGQIGSELVDALAAQHGAENVIAADISPSSLYGANIYEVVDVLNTERLAEIHDKYEITQVYQLAALLSATGEKAPLKAWTLNMDGLLNILELARIRGEAGKPLKVFWPSSIAAFGPNTEAVNTPQYTVMDPNTIYGISKLAGERLCEYYFQKYNVDVRSIRYPGIISYKSPPGGGTTDYAIAIFHSALKGEAYSCFLEAQQSLPMIYMPDAIRATISLMDAPIENIKIRSSYNVSGMSFNPQELTSEITKNLPNFQVHYAPDSRQAIAASWPQSLNDEAAFKDWGWKAEIDLPALVTDMLKNVKVSS
ncbi:NAD-dependent epimerase/dehydratase family protein [Undibacterium flavidum]|uniref:NAD-dependent epimerase/dehydratase family protein n=1 Tax=Undibacterium flavidum TaxID=2762297 RepID=A0ABR6Y6B5_9BURK|nr:NAD-dependent epimerase/dehydratase family protein [Undibacterium flavidum]MBC3872151.1 NAD-dependent epimerase/dehydratase family protein [Undibacterium flavidum]